MHLHYRPTEETQRERKEYETLNFSTRPLKLFFGGGGGGWGGDNSSTLSTSNCEDCKNKYMIENKAGKVKVVTLNVREQSLKLYLITNNHIYGSCFRKIITIQKLEEKPTI